MSNNIRYMNQTAPFWDFVADMEGRGYGPSNPRNPTGNANENQNDNEAPWAGYWGWPFGPLPHHGRHGRHGRGGHRGGRHHGPPGPPPPPQAEAQAEEEYEDPPIMTPATEKDEAEAGPSEPRGPPPAFSEKQPEQAPHPEGHHHNHRGGHRGPRGRCNGRRGRGPPSFSPFNVPENLINFPPYSYGGPELVQGLQNLGTMFQEQLFGSSKYANEQAAKDQQSKSDDFRPEVDVFDTVSSFVVHVSLPGAKKEDVGVSWDAEKSELLIAGVVYRPGDEEMLKTLALDERKVGAFERKVRLGSRANPAFVDVEGIAAKLEDGVLRVEVPKMNGDFVEVKKVQIE